MSIRKFNVGDLVVHRSRRDFWIGRLGLIVDIIYTHGNAAYHVKWRRLHKVRRHHQRDLRPP